MIQRGFLILDFGSQVTQLIARRLRELGYYSEIHPFSFPIEEIKKRQPYGIILSGGPNSVYEVSSPRRSVRELEQVSPLLGICYGMQLIVHDLGGEVERATSREYGFNTVEWSEPIAPIPVRQRVWMSHGDVVKKAPPGTRVIGKTASHPAALRGERILAVQFHPEVAHTEHGQEILREFAKMCKAPQDWQAPQIRDLLQQDIIRKVGPSDHVLCALSGGVDSSVVATLLTKTLGAERVNCLFVDNGLLRKNEYESVLSNYKKIGLNVLGVDARTEFMTALKGVSDPEKKRKAIGRVFIEVFDASLEKMGKNHIQWLAQGTLYPDVIESVSSTGGSVTIKSHHNVGGLPEKMKMKLIEPVRELFKDEVRRIGAELGLPHDMLWRHPFPGPGLAIRILGDVDEKKLQVLREADDVYVSALKEFGLYDKIWQAFCVLLPVQAVGVQGDNRTYERVLALRAVTSQDGMTADWFPFDFEFLREVSNRITNKVRGINRVVYDVTSKPPATIEWE
jgi:GMP synthase (glutamine-hydrolysing)